MTTSVTSTASAAASALVGSSSNTTSNASSATGANQTLGEDAFLKLLMAQLANQDPLQPADSTQFVTQLSQFSMVEQSVQQSTTLSSISSQLQGLAGGQANGLIGKMATVQNTTMAWNGTFATTANVTLGGAAQSVSVAVQDSSGNTVRTLTMGPQPAGPLQVTWDGKKTDGTAAPSGSYSATVTAVDASGQSVNVGQTISGIVTQVSPNQGAPTMTLNNGAVAPVSQLVSVAAAPVVQSATSNNTTP
jgi:flagellar basal-body rod modification protein FlgD